MGHSGTRLVNELIELEWIARIGGEIMWLTLNVAGMASLHSGCLVLIFANVHNVLFNHRSLD